MTEVPIDKVFIRYEPSVLTKRLEPLWQEMNTFKRLYEEENGAEATEQNLLPCLIPQNQRGAIEALVTEVETFLMLPNSTRTRVTEEDYKTAEALLGETQKILKPVTDNSVRTYTNVLGTVGGDLLYAAHAYSHTLGKIFTFCRDNLSEILGKFEKHSAGELADGQQILKSPAISPSSIKPDEMTRNRNDENSSQIQK